MSNDQTTTTGTRPPDDADALEQAGTSGTPDGEQSRDAESGEQTDWKGIALANKQRIADLEAKLRDSEGGQQQPPVAEDPEVQDRNDQIDKVEAQVEEFRRRGDPVAAFAMEERAARLRLERDLILKAQLDDIPKTEHKAVIKYFNQNRHRIGDITGAYNEMRTPTLEREVEELRTQLANLKKGPDPEVVNAVPTGGHEFTARETKKRLTEDQFDAQAANIRATKGELAYLKYVRENARNL